MGEENTMQKWAKSFDAALGAIASHPKREGGESNKFERFYRVDITGWMDIAGGGHNVTFRAHVGVKPDGSCDAWDADTFAIAAVKWYPEGEESFIPISGALLPDLVKNDMANQAVDRWFEDHIDDGREAMA